MLIEPAWINGPRHEGRRWLSERRNCREGYGLSSKLKNTLRCKLLKIGQMCGWVFGTLSATGSSATPRDAVVW
jgi:hypothetical protein